MSRIFLDKCEIALSQADLRHAMMLWIERCTMASRSDYTLEHVSLHPGNKYVVRMTVKPAAVVKKAAEAASASGPMTEPSEPADSAVK